MAQRISDIATEHLENVGGLATEATVAQFKRACNVYLERLESDPAAPEATDFEDIAVEYVWNEGRFDVRIRELLGEEVAF